MQVTKVIKRETLAISDSVKEAMRTPDCIRLPKVKMIEQIVTENKLTRTFFFRYPEIVEIASPGQFVMLGVFQKLIHRIGEEVPLSLSYARKEEGIIGVTVKQAGSTTRALFKHTVGDEVTLRGPYGKGFELKGSNVAVIGGGIGIAPLAYLVEELIKNHIIPTVFLGGKNASELLFVERIRKTSAKMVLATEDGSVGEKGKITDVFANYLTRFVYDHVYTCGRERMMKKILSLCLKYDIPAQFSLERYIKCGRGVCGHCAIDGYRVCTDGPVFPLEIVKKLKDFGKQQLDESGSICKLTY